MKCPKCDYLGFETSDRCRHCGYDFSLATRAAEPPDVDLRAPEPAITGVGELWLRDRAKELDEAGAGTRLAGAGSFPLFPSLRPDDDEPLIRVPREPRAPLSVRRAPEPPRVRPSPRVSSAVESSPVLDFAGEETALPQPTPSPSLHGPLVQGRPSPEPPSPELAPSGVSGPPGTTPGVGPGAVSSLARRALAAATDHAILFGVDAVVIYCTLRMAGLSMADWRMLPPVPFFAFLGMIKVAYFTAFTAMGGQTIGKMAVGIRVVGDLSDRVEPGRAIRRTVTSAVSVLPLGLGLLPALLGMERRTLHDRIAGTRVVDLPSA